MKILKWFISVLVAYFFMCLFFSVGSGKLWIFPFVY